MKKQYGPTTGYNKVRYSAKVLEKIVIVSIWGGLIKQSTTNYNELKLANDSNGVAVAYYRTVETVISPISDLQGPPWNWNKREIIPACFR